MTTGAISVSSKRVAIVIAAYNEGSVIADVVRDALRLFPLIVVVDDGSPDDTGAAALLGGAVVLRHPINLGQGAALQTGIEYALGQDVDFVVTFDADGQHRPEDVQKMLEELADNGKQVALGSRFLGETVGMPVSRRWLLKAATVFTRITTGLRVTDAHNGLRTFRRDAAQAITIRQNRMAHASEILEEIGRKKLTYCEVPVTIHYTDYSKAKGQSGLGAFNILIDLLVARIRK
jgi:glycosyltransferase involved in cell wall biosynthesis